jgi:hypothetical protein
MHPIDVEVFLRKQSFLVLFKYKISSNQRHHNKNNNIGIGVGPRLLRFNDINSECLVLFLRSPRRSENLSPEVACCANKNM